MLEESILTSNELREELARRYKIKKIKKISKIPQGSANISKIECEKGKFILKEYQSSYKIEDFQQEVKITLLLKKRRIPCVTFVPDINKKFFWNKKGHVFVLQEFVEGKTKKSNRGSKSEILESAKYLSKINQALKNVNLNKQEPMIRWLSKESLNQALGKYDKILRECEKRITNPEVRKIKEDILFKRDALTKVISNKKFLKSLEKVTHLNSHGDYSVLQFIYDKNNKIKTILDFSAAAKLPIAWEIIRSYSYIDPACKKGKISMKGLREYVQEYTKNQSLTKLDLEMMPYVYLIQLLKSSFGYSQYVLENTKNKNELIKFAFWRTNICRWLISNSKKLSQELVKLME